MTERTWAGSHPAHAFPRGLTWFNVQEPLTLEYLRGKVVLLDFWTLGCINCQHIVRDLQRLEAEFPETLAVIGVHSGKFATEQTDESIKEAIGRLRRTHPVVNDEDFEFWERYGVRAWPTIVAIDPAGNLVGYHEGEGVYQLFRPVIEQLEEEFVEQIDRRPLPVTAEATAVSPVLRFPGALAADEERGRLFIADSGNNRIVVTNLTGDVECAIGTGDEGFADGDAANATFRQPQGVAVSADGRTVYIADTRNHAIRAIDTDQWRVRTIAGTGERLSQLPQPGMDPRQVELASPWGLAVAGNMLYIAMAGLHQLWVMDLAAESIEVFAGTSREGLDDGPRLTMATLAQPSGMTADASFVYWADAEASAIRRVGYGEEALVDTLLGRGLFEYGNDDGGPGEGQLQHPQDVVVLNGILFIADTYNHAIRALDPGRRELTTVAGSRERGWHDGTGQEAQFSEPSGITTANGLLYIADTNNHVVRVVQPQSGLVSTMQLNRIGRIGAAAGGQTLRFEAPPQEVEPGAVTLRLRVTAPAGYHLNSLGGSRLAVSSSDNAVFEPREMELNWATDERGTEVTVELNGRAGEAMLTGSGEVYFCEEGATERCYVAQVQVTAPVRVTDGAGTRDIVLDVTLPKP